MSESRKDTVRVFKGREIRVAWNEEEQKELYSVIDVCGALTESSIPRRYWTDLKRKLKHEGIELYEKIVQLKRFAPDGKMRLTDVADADTIFELIKYIKSKETEAFRSWLSGIVEEYTADHAVRAVAARKYDPVFDTDYETHVETILAFVEDGFGRIYRHANREVIRLYWRTGEYISEKAKNENWGQSVVQELAARLRKEAPDLKGFSPQNIWRMKQFYETYRDDRNLLTLAKDITWSNNMMIIAGAKTEEEREFYLRQCKELKYTVHDLQRQIKSSIFERQKISDVENKELIEANRSLSALHTPVVVEFLGLPDKPTEYEMRKAIVADIQTFILELGKDFSFVKEEYRVRVDDRDFYVDLVFYNHRLSCYLAVELKTVEFHPDHLGRMTFYLEALDRDLKGPHDDPSIGLIICAGKRDMVVEYSMSGNMPKTLIAKYERCLPDKELLKKRLREMKEQREHMRLEEDEGVW